VAGAVTEELSPRHSKLMNYRWADTSTELNRLAAASADPVVKVEYVDPETGASVLPTMACAVHRIRAGQRSAPERRAGNAIYVVFQGSGSSVIEGEQFNWSPGDMFVVPSWAAVEHAAEVEGDLFVVTDEPVLRALGIARREVLDAPQTVTRTFTPR
jgi:gentisate 1,2-dioxygenase